MLSEQTQLALLGVTFIGFVIFRVGQHFEARLKGSDDTARKRRWRIVWWVGLLLAFASTSVVFYVRVIRHNQ